MPSAPRFRLSVLFSIALFLIPVVSLAQTEGKSASKKKMTGAHTATQTAPTQTAPAQPGQPPGAKGAAQTAPVEPGAQTISGRIIMVHPERKAVVIRGATTDFQVYIGPQTKVLRDGQAVDIQKIKVNDMVSSCHFNAKHVVSKIELTSVERGLGGSAVATKP